MVARLDARVLAFALTCWTLSGAGDCSAQAPTPSPAVPADTDVVIQASPADSVDLLVEFRRHARSSRLGYFIDERQMAALHSVYASDALRRVPGVTVRPSRGGGNQVRIRGCAPLVWIAGQRTPGAELDDVARGNDVAAIEVYRSLSGVPAEFTDRTAICGTIIVWLRTS
jgi:hypothetical protein